MCADGGACPEGFHCGADRRCHVGDKTDVSARRGGGRAAVQRSAARRAVRSDLPAGVRVRPLQPGRGQARVRAGRAARSPATFATCRTTTAPRASSACASRAAPKTRTRGFSWGAATGTARGTSTATACRATCPSSAPSPRAMRACQLPPRTCDPVTATTSCGSPLLGCYVESNGRLVLRLPGAGGAATSLRLVDRLRARVQMRAARVAGRRRVAGGCAGWTGRTACPDERVHGDARRCDVRLLHPLTSERRLSSFECPPPRRRCRGSLI